MKGLRPLLPLLATAGAAHLVFAAAARAATLSTSPVLEVQSDKSTVVAGQNYRAVIGADGNLHSLRVGEVEMLDDRVAISLGAFFYAYADGPRRLARVTTLNPRAVEATDGTFTAQYRFYRQEIRVYLTNNGRAPVPYFVVLSPEITIASNLGTGEAAAAPSTERWGDVRFSAPNGAYVELVGGTGIYGPWLGRQVWEVSRVIPGQQTEVHIKVGLGEPPKPTLEQLVGLRVKVGAAGALVPVDNPVELQVSVENRSETALSGQLSMELSASRHDQVIYANSLLQLPPRQSTSTTFRALVEAPDFYAARVTLSAQGRELASARAVAGYRAAEIRPSVERPADFRDFWQRLIAEVGDQAPDYRLDVPEEPSGKEITVWVARYAGLTEKAVYGWYLYPEVGGPRPAILYLSGYGGQPIRPPLALARQGYVVLAVDVRGNPVGRPRSPRFEDYSTQGIGSPETYVYREIVGHALRAVQFLRARQEVDPQRIAVVGVSEGGGVGLILAALSPHVKAVAVDAPMLCDFPLSLRAGGWPYVEIARYLQRNPEKAAQARGTLAYFDVVNFAPDIGCPVLVSTGFLDPVSLPAAVYGMFNPIPGPKELRPFPQAGHEGGGQELWTYKLAWLARNLSAQPAQ